MEYTTVDIGLSLELAGLKYWHKEAWSFGCCLTLNPNNDGRRTNCINHSEAAFTKRLRLTTPL